MRHANSRSSAHQSSASPHARAAEVHFGSTLKNLLPYLWPYRIRVFLALFCLVGAKAASVFVPLIFKEMIDSLSVTQQVLALPVLLLGLYGALRFAASLL
ncbi:MAG: metal ABC transporter permease, partial [Pseudomonadota bacterium]